MFGDNVSSDFNTINNPPTTAPQGKQEYEQKSKTGEDKMARGAPGKDGTPENIARRKTSSFAFKFSAHRKTAQQVLPPTGTADEATKSTAVSAAIGVAEPKKTATAGPMPKKQPTEKSTRRAGPKSTVSRKTEPAANRVVKSSAKSNTKSSSPPKKNMARGVASAIGNLWDNIDVGRRKTKNSRLISDQLTPGVTYLTCKSASP